VPTDTPRRRPSPVVACVGKFSSARRSARRQKLQVRYVNSARTSSCIPCFLSLSLSLHSQTFSISLRTSSILRSPLSPFFCPSFYNFSSLSQTFFCSLSSLPLSVSAISVSNYLSSLSQSLWAFLTFPLFSSSVYLSMSFFLSPPFLHFSGLSFVLFSLLLFLRLSLSVSLSLSFSPSLAGSSHSSSPSLSFSHFFCYLMCYFTFSILFSISSSSSSSLPPSLSLPFSTPFLSSPLIPLTEISAGEIVGARCD